MNKPSPSSPTVFLVQDDDCWVELVAPEVIRPLRHRLLLSWHPFERTMYPDDDTETTGHFGVYVRGELLGITSVYRQDPEIHGLQEAWRIRGVATEEKIRGKGLGRLLMQAVEKYVHQQGGSWLWCNARTPAVPFYERTGFHRLGEEYHIEGIGPHYFMAREVGKDGMEW